MKLTVLAAQQKSEGFCSEFGLSLLLQQNGEKILFDTGAGSALLPNLNRLGVDPDSLAKVVLSHGHYDHTGGLAGLHPKEVWCCDGIQDPHFSRHEDGEMHDLTMPEASQAVLKNAEIHCVEKFTSITPELFLTGPIPRISGEDCGGNFFHDVSCHEPDEIPEEQALLTLNGVLITGCCHAGIVNTLIHCRKMLPELPIHTIIGGLHLIHTDRNRLTQTAEFFRVAGIRRLYLMHCTGAEATDFLKQTLPDCRIFIPKIGETIEI